MLRLIDNWSRCIANLGALCVTCLAAAPNGNLFAQQMAPAGQYRAAGPANAANVANPFRRSNTSSYADPNDPDLYGGPSDVYDAPGYDAPGSWDDGGPYQPYGSGPSYSRSSNRHPSTGWFAVEYLGWALDGNHLPPLVTSSPANTPLVNAGQLDETTTTILSGNQTVNGSYRSGARFSGGLWIDPCSNFGIGADYFYLGDDDYDFVSPQNSGIITARPFFNTQTGQDDAELVSVPNQLDGTATVNAGDEFWGAGITLNRCIWCCRDSYYVCGYSQLNVLGGYRHYEYESSLSINEDLTVLPGTTTPLVPGTTILVSDNFRTKNQFNGAEIGLQGMRSRGWWWYDGLAKVAIGRNRRTVWIDGQTVSTVPGGGTTTSAGGLLTSSVTNIGTYRDSEFAVIPEFRLGLGGNISPNLSCWVGYNVILWGDITRAADVLPPGLEVDPRNLPPVQAGGGDEPLFPGLGGSQLVAHGIDVGIMWQW